MKFELTELEEIAGRRRLAGKLQSILEPFAALRDVLRALTPDEELEPLDETVAILRKILHPHEVETSYREDHFRLMVLFETILQEGAEFDRRHLLPIQPMAVPQSFRTLRRKTVRKRRRRGNRSKGLKK